MRKVLISEPVSHKALSLFEGKAEIVMARGTSQEDVLADIGDVFGILLKSKTRITERILEAAPELRVISRTGTGYDNVDVDAASERNVMVCNLPGVNAPTVAEQTMACILALAKHIPEMDGYVRKGQWGMRSRLIPMDVAGKTLGIVGLGQIGYRVMKLAQAFGMMTLASDPYMQESLKNETAFAASLEELFEVSDFITIHVPNLPGTRRMITASLLERVKPGAFIINTSRGEVMDEEALIRSLKENRLAGAALDVFDQEPPPMDHPFLEMKHVILSPHTAALTKECGTRMAVKAAAQIVDCLEGRIPPFIVNRERIDLAGTREDADAET